MKKNNFIFISLLALSVQQGYAQIIGTDAFLGGTYLEVGVSGCGSYGTLDSVPAGFHTNNNYNQGMGFVADAEKNGWAVGLPGFCGDYFLPGDPEEGWSVTINGASYGNNNGTGNICSRNDFTGSVNNYVNAGNKVSVYWTGTGNGLDVNQLTYFNLDSLYFTTKVELTNISGGVLNDVYYMRNVDPDNENAWTGNYVTDNTIHYQNPSLTNQALVYAKGQMYGCFIGLGANDSRAKVTFGGFTNRDAKAVWDGIAPFTQSGSGTGDVAISVSFNLGNIDTGETVCLYFAYILDSLQLEDAIRTPAIRPTFLANGNDITSGGFVLGCQGDSVSFEIQDDSGFSWTWVPDTLLTIDTGRFVTAVISPDIQLYKVLGTKNCESYTYNISMITIPPPLVNLGPDKSFCEGQSTLLNAGNPGAQYFLWSTGDTTQTIPVSDSGVYWVIVTDCGRSDTDTIQIAKIPTPFVDLGPDTTFCSGPPLVLDAGNPGAVYQWSTLSMTRFINAYTTGLYSVSVTMNGCTGTDAINITVNQTPAVDFGPDTSICVGDILILDAGNPSAIHLWSTGDTGSSITVTTPGTYWVYNVMGPCDDRDTIVVGVNPAPVVNLGPDTSICALETITFDAGNPGLAYLWATGDTTRTVTYNVGGVYSVSVSNGNCTRADSVVLTVIPLPIIDLGQDTSFCEGYMHVLSAGSPLNVYYWSNGDTGLTTQVASSARYYVTASYLGCEKMDSINIQVFAKPPLDLGPDKKICLTQSLAVDAGPAASYTWSTGASSRVIFVNENDTVWAIVTDNRGCVSDTAYKAVIVEQCNCTEQEIYVPNAFTPEDGKNNVLYVHGTPSLKVVQFSVYNRWGEVVFEARNTGINDLAGGWDGTYKGSILHPQVFAWFVKAECFDGTVLVKKGNVTLLK